MCTTVTDLCILVLETLAHGNDVLDWACVHTSVHISNVAELRQCTYAGRVVTVDENLQILTGVSTTMTDCVVDVTRSAQCHVELPEKVVNQVHVVGLDLRPTSGSRTFSDTDDVSAEFALFMCISQCPTHSFLDTDTMCCTEDLVRRGQCRNRCLELRDHRVHQQHQYDLLRSASTSSPDSSP
jgi:hypothetical protein